LNCRYECRIDCRKGKKPHKLALGGDTIDLEKFEDNIGVDIPEVPIMIDGEVVGGREKTIMISPDKTMFFKEVNEQGFGESGVHGRNRGTCHHRRIQGTRK